jgi:hypothetical protein
MSTKCFSCGANYGKKLLNCPSCKEPNLDLLNWIPEELKIEYKNNRISIRDEPTIEQMKKNFEKAAEECNFQINSLSIENILDEGEIDVAQPDEDFHNLAIRFNPKLLSRHSEEELMAMARHEIMHPVTMGERSIVLLSKDQTSAELDLKFSQAFDEMINYKEYTKKFPNDPGLKSYQMKKLVDYVMHFLNGKYFAQKNIIDNPLRYIIRALVIYCDAVYFFYDSKDALNQLVTKYEFQALYKFWTWIHDDFNLIHDAMQSRDEMRLLMPIILHMVLNIYPDMLFSANRIVFTEDAYDNILNYKDKITDPIGKKIVDSWEKRFIDQPYYFD